MKGRITKVAVDRLQAGTELHDTEVVGFIARCLPSGLTSYAFRYRVNGNRSMVALGLHGSITADEARTLAKQRAGDVAHGIDPAAVRVAARVKIVVDATRMVNAVLDEHVKRHVAGLKSADVITSAFDRLVRPAMGDKLIYDLKRSDIVDMLDEVEDECGPSMADHVLAYVRKAFNWQMARENDWVSPIIRGMNRLDPKERRRKRILTDEEIRDVWLAAERAAQRNDEPRAPSCFPQFIALLFLTAQRRSAVAQWHSDAINGESWIIPGDDYKNGETQLVPITSAIDSRLPLRKGFMVSSDGGKTGFAGFSKAKTAIDVEIAAVRKVDGRKPMPHWVFHDIRRTSRSIMSRYATPDIAERVLGHALPGVRGVYDHYEYADEKRLALEALAAHVLGVVHPDPRKIVPLRGYVSTSGA